MKTNNNLKFYYAHTMSFPTSEANAFDAVWTASALAREVNTTFIIKSASTGIDQLKQFYYIPDTKLKFRSLHLDKVPDRLLLKIGYYYARALSGLLRISSAGKPNQLHYILYMRDPKLMRFMGLQREKQSWLKNWILVYESHDPLGLDPSANTGEKRFSVTAGADNLYQQKMLRAAGNMDVFICNTQALADDLRQWSGGRLDPAVISLASPLPRLMNPPVVKFGEKIILGYIGTIDTFRGVDILVKALRYLPDNFSLRLVGKFRQELGVDASWLQTLLSEPEIGSKVDLKLTDHIADVAAEIDHCDILVQPASENILDARYATPQKSFGYMVRGKPILAGDVPCHRELFLDGVNVLMYQLTPQDLAEKAQNLTANPVLAHTIAFGAWERSANFTYEERVKNILSLILPGQ